MERAPATSNLPMQKHPVTPCVKNQGNQIGIIVEMKDGTFLNGEKEKREGKRCRRKSGRGTRDGGRKKMRKAIQGLVSKPLWTLSGQCLN